MTGWLIYEDWNVARNQFFIGKWQDAARVRGVALHLVTTAQVAWGVDQGGLFLRWQGVDSLPDFVVMRAPLPLLSFHLEALKVPVFNNARLSQIANDKRRTHQLFSGILPMMDSAFVNQTAFLQPFPWPVVVKGSSGCGGRQVYLAQDEAGYRQALASLAPDSAVVQPLCDSPGKDMRVYVLGGEIIATMLRYSEGDIRSNVGLGAQSKPIPLPDEVRGYVQQVLSRLQVGLVGIDFIYHQGALVFNEIEDAVGTRMLYMHTQRDIAADYLDLILRSLTNVN